MTHRSNRSVYNYFGLRRTTRGRFECSSLSVPRDRHPEAWTTSRAYAGLCWCRLSVLGHTCTPNATASAWHHWHNLKSRDARGR